MVVDTAYYDTLGISPTASDLEIKKAYRKLAITTHPDKNPDDESANEKFQAIGEAYQVLSDETLRKQYDKHGKDEAVPGGGFEDPSAVFTMIFGGDAFVDYIGEITLMKDLAATMEVTMQEGEEEELAGETESKLNVNEQPPSYTESQTATPGPSSTPEKSAPSAAEEKETPSSAHNLNVPGSEKKTPESGSGTSTPRPLGSQYAITDKSDEDMRTDASLSQEEKELRQKEKKKRLTQEQADKLIALEQERKAKRQERVNTLSEKLVSRLSVLTETDKGADVVKAFEEKIRLETEDLKMESFGVEILHAIGFTYVQKATSFLKSQKFLGISGFFSRLKDKGTIVKEGWTSFLSAVDTHESLRERAVLEEKGFKGWTDEEISEYEKTMIGKMLATGWRGSKWEIQGVLRNVCDQVLYDKSVPLDKRMDRAKALMICGRIYQQAKRNPDEEGEYMAFEELMAEAVKKGKEDKKKSSKKGKAEETSKKDKVEETSKKDEAEEAEAAASSNQHGGP